MRSVMMVLAAATFSSQAMAGLLSTVTFDNYTPGNLAGQGLWTAFSGIGSNPVQVVSVAAGDNEAALTAGSGSREDVRLALGSIMGAGDKWYAGFDITVSGPTNAADYFFAFYQDLGASGSGFPTKVGIFPGGGNNFSVYAHQGSGSGTPGTPSATTQPWATDLAYGTTYRIVMSYTYDTGAGELWLNPDLNLGAAGNTKLDVINASSAGFEATHFALRQGGAAAGALTVDNIAVATTWGEAAAIPEPATLGLLAGAGLLALRRR